MKIRIKFKVGEQKEFIQKIYLKSGFSTEELAKIAKVNPRSFRDWRREKLTMTLESAEIFCKKYRVQLPEDKQKLVARWKNIRAEISRKGGMVRFDRHGSPATLEGRKKGGAKTLANLRKDGIIPVIKVYKQPNTGEELAEYIGIMLGDGGITPGQCTITCNSIADKEYIEFVCKLGKRLFGEEPKRFKKKDCNAITIYYNGSSLVKYFVQMGLKVGNKVKQQVDVPDWIKQSKNYSVACLRGLMDTDGGIFLHRYKVNRKIYIYRKISFSNRSIPLLLFVVNTLDQLGFNPKLINKVENKKVWLYNQTEVYKYLKIVGTNNPRLLKHGEVA